jgi:phosphoglycerol transferase
MKLGFGAIYLDSRGYKDGGLEMIGKWKSILKKDPDLVREDGKIYVFYLPQEKQPFKKPIVNSLAQELTDFGPNGFTYPSKLGSEFFFARPGVPSFLTRFSGLSNPESWGRWSDARISRNVEFVFAKSLPANFDLNIKVLGYEPNIGKSLQIISGSQIRKITLSGNPKVHKLNFRDNFSASRTITFKIPTPISPSEHNGSGDNRLLSVGFISLQVIPLD